MKCVSSYFQKILVPVDGSLSCLRAQELAVSFAKNFDSTVTVVHVVSHDFMHPELKAHYQLPSLILLELEKSYLRTGEKIIRAATDFFRENGVEVQTELIKHEDPAEKVLQMVKDANYDTIIIGNRSETPTSRYSLGSIAEKISLYSKCSVLIAKRKTKIKKILVAVDGSQQADKATEHAAVLAERFNAKMTLLHVEEQRLFELEPELTKNVGNHILNHTANKVQTTKMETRLELGNPAKTILKIAKDENQDLIVMGSRGISSVKRFLLGSVSADVSMNSQRSVLIVR